uniref:Mitochondrial carnitine/acylcarnitine carrier-like protein n=1 Tax=Salix viminalis TaxID=40686 RepID=A0A6N2JZH1_SALVM
MGDVAKDLTAGTIGGAAQLIVGHPFDTIKVKLQSQPAPLPGQAPKFAGAVDAVKQTLSAEGPRGLYKGMGAPFATVAAFNAVLFTVRGQMEGLLRSQPGAPLTVNQQVVAGAGAGVAVSFLACPTELIKCSFCPTSRVLNYSKLHNKNVLGFPSPLRLQAQSALASSDSAVVAVKYGGALDVTRHVLKSEGGVRGLFKGLVPTMAREIPGSAAMFGVYELLKQSFAGGEDTSQLGRGSLIVAGGLAGASFWVSVYPTDVVKSVIQVDDYKNPKFSGSVDAFRKILASEGVKGLYKGFGPAMARSVPANAACFLAYEVTRRKPEALQRFIEVKHFSDNKMEAARHSHSSMPLVSRLDHLDFALCLELDSSSTSATSSRTSGYASSGQGLPTFTLATFNNPNRGESLDNASRVALQEREKSQMQEQERKHSKPTKQKLGKNRADKDEKKCKSGKKKVTPKWPRLKLLGC